MSACLPPYLRRRDRAVFTFSAIMCAQIPAQQTKGRQSRAKINTASPSKNPSRQLEEHWCCTFFSFLALPLHTAQCQMTRGGTRTRHVLTERKHKTWHLHCWSALVVNFLLSVQVEQNAASQSEGKGCVSSSCQSLNTKLRWSPQTFFGAMFAVRVSFSWHASSRSWLCPFNCGALHFASASAAKLPITRKIILLISFTKA